MGVFVRTLIFLFLGLFTLASLAEVTPKPVAGARQKLLVLPPARKPDLTLNRQPKSGAPVNKGPSKGKLFDWIKMRWVDIGDWYARNKLFEEDGGDSKDKGGSTSMGSTVGKNNSGAKSTASNKPKGTGYGYDENAAKTPATTPEKPGDDGHDHGGGGGKPPGTGGGGVPPGENGIAHPLWWPVCVFIDPRVPNGNEIVKTMVDMAGRCGVVTVPFAIPIQQLPNPDNERQINDFSQRMCNVHKALGVPDISSLVATPSDTAADEMCKSLQGNPPKPTTTVAGCNQVRAGGGDPTRMQQLLGRVSGGESLQMGAPGAQLGIIDNQGHNGAVAAHEAYGHGMMGWPNGSSAGNGIHDPADPPHAGDHSHSGGWTDKGCNQMKKMAYANTGGKYKWNPNQALYYNNVPAQNQWPLGQPLYGNPPNVVPPPSNPPGQPPSAPPPAIVRGDPPPSQLDPDFGKPSGPPADANPPPGHRKPGGGSGLVSIRNGGAGVSDVPGSVGKGSTKGYGYDESGAKVPAGDSTAILDPISPATAKPGETKGYGYDESNAKTANGTASGSELGGAGGSGKPGESGASDPSKDENPKGGTVSTDGRRTPASILNDVKAMAAELDDDFFNKVKLGREKDERKKRGEALRQPSRATKPVY